MAFKIFNKEINSNIDALKDKIPSVNKLTGFFGKKQNVEIEKKEPEVPLAGGMEETANIFNMDYSEQQKVQEEPSFDVPVSDVGNEEENIEVKLEPEVEPEAPSEMKTDDSVFDEFHFDLTLPKESLDTEPNVSVSEEMQVSQEGAPEFQNPETENINEILDAPDEKTDEYDGVSFEQNSSVPDIGGVNSFNDGLADELQQIDEESVLPVLEQSEPVSEETENSLIFDGETLDDNTVENSLEFNSSSEINQNENAEISLGTEDTSDNIFNQQNSEIFVENETVASADVDNIDREGRNEEVFSDIPTQNSNNESVDALPEAETDFAADFSDVETREQNEEVLLDSSEQSEPLEPSEQPELLEQSENFEMQADAIEADTVDADIPMADASVTSVSPQADERYGVYQEPVIQHEVETPQNTGYWNDTVSPFIKWYSDETQSFSVSKDSQSVVIEGTDECHCIHVNVGYSTYGWIVQFNNGRVMNLGDIKEFQLRKGYLPDTSGKICYGDLTFPFNGIDKITVYESVQYFSYGL